MVAFLRRPFVDMSFNVSTVYSICIRGFIMKLKGEPIPVENPSPTESTASLSLAFKEQ